MSSALETLIKNRIKKEGAMSVADYMALALSHPEHGYYMRKDPLGVSGDFTTAPEISQIFGELIGLWIAEQWRVLGKPDAALIELGPGRGTLMADMLRATKMVQGFHDAVSVHLVETSPLLKQKQWKLLAGKHSDMHWHTDIGELPKKPWLMVANEFFDALPIRQFVHENAWKERMVGLDEKGNFTFTLAPTSVIPAQAEIQFYEKNEPAEKITGALSYHIKNHGGAALIIDYGYTGGTRADTLQALKNHAYHDILSEPGNADITAHVDFDALKNAAQHWGASIFGPAPQGAFLGRLGAIARAMHLCEGAPEDTQGAIMSGLTRILSPERMGDLFKALAICPPNHPTPEGF